MIQSHSLQAYITFNSLSYAEKKERKQISE